MAGESVADFNRRLEKTFRVDYVREAITPETRNALLYGQLHEGLLYQLMEAPAVSGAINYPFLVCGSPKRGATAGGVEQAEAVPVSPDESVSSNMLRNLNSESKRDRAQEGEYWSRRRKDCTYQHGPE